MELNAARVLVTDLAEARSFYETALALPLKIGGEGQGAAPWPHSWIRRATGYNLSRGERPDGSVDTFASGPHPEATVQRSNAAMPTLETFIPFAIAELALKAQHRAPVPTP